MLENPVTMPDYGNKKKGKQKGTVYFKGRAYSNKLQQKGLARHRQPDIYVETKVSKRRS